MSDSSAEATEAAAAQPVESRFYPVPGENESEPPLLAILSPVQEGTGFLIRGRAEDVFPGLIQIARPQRSPLGEEDWLTSSGVAYVPPRRDPVVAADYSPVESETRILYRFDELTSATPGVIPFQLQTGQAFLRGLKPGPYCLLVPGPRPIAATVEVAGPVTLVRSDAWEPALYQYTVSLLRTLDKSSLEVALSSAPFAQVNPLIKRLRVSAAISPVELYVFYRGYYEGLSLARWVESSPDGRIEDFITRLKTNDSYIDQLVSEALRQQELTRDLAPAAGDANAAAYPPGGSPARPWAASIFDDGSRPGLPHYRSYYYVGLATLFLSEADDKSIPLSSGEFFHPDEARLYEEQCREMARRCVRWAQSAWLENPLVPVLQGHMEFRVAP